MTREGKVPSLECVVVDLNTQRDFLDPKGAYPVANRDELIPALRRVIAWTKRNHCPVVSSIDAHREFELRTEQAPPHCLDGSPGQRKVDFTVFPLHDRVEFDNTLAVPLDLFRFFQQVIFRKRQEDLLTNPKADQFLTELPVAEFILFGIGLESAVKILSLGLLARNNRVTVVTDACGFWDRSKAELACRQLSAKGALLISVDELLRRKLSRRHRYPLHPIAPIGPNGFEHIVRVNGHPAQPPKPKPRKPRGLPPHGQNGTIGSRNRHVPRNGTA